MSEDLKSFIVLEYSTDVFTEALCDVLETYGIYVTGKVQDCAAALIDACNAQAMEELVSAEESESSFSDFLSSD